MKKLYGGELSCNRMGSITSQSTNGINMPEVLGLIAKKVKVAVWFGFIVDKRYFKDFCLVKKEAFLPDGIFPYLLWK